MQVPTPPGQALDAHPGNVSLHNQTCCVCIACLLCCVCTCITQSMEKKAASERFAIAHTDAFATNVACYPMFTHMLSISACTETSKITPQ